MNSSGKRLRNRRNGPYLTKRGSLDWNPEEKAGLGSSIFPLDQVLKEAKSDKF